MGLQVTQGGVFMSDKRRKFTPEFRAEAVKLVTDTGWPVAHVAAEIGSVRSCWAANSPGLQRARRCR